MSKKKGLTVRFGEYRTTWNWLQSYPIDLLSKKHPKVKVWIQSKVLNWFTFRRCFTRSFRISCSVIGIWKYSSFGITSRNSIMCISGPCCSFETTLSLVAGNTSRVLRGNSDQKFKISFYFSSFFCISHDSELAFRPCVEQSVLYLLTKESSKKDVL